MRATAILFLALAAVFGLPAAHKHQWVAGLFGDAKTDDCPAPMTQIIKIEGEHKSYIVKLESLVGPIRFHPGDGVDYSVEGRHLYIQFAGKEFRTEILSMN